MTVRQATPDDLERVLGYARLFHKHSIWKHVPLDEEALSATLLNMMASEDGAIFLSETGMCGGLINGLYFAPSYRVAVELFWWAQGGGKALKAAFEAWATERGATAIQFSALADERLDHVGRLYSMSGFKPVEVLFLKEAG